MQSSPSIVSRLRARPLFATFAILATVSAAILFGSYTAHGVHGQEKEPSASSTDATPLKIPNTTVTPNAFAQIAKQVGPAVVNINTRTLPKDASNLRKRGMPNMPANPHRNMPVPQAPEDDDQGGDGDATPQAPGPGQGQGQVPGGQGNFQDFFNRFFGGQVPGEGPDDGSNTERDALGSGFIVDPQRLHRHQ